MLAEAAPALEQAFSAKPCSALARARESRHVGRAQPEVELLLILRCRPWEKTAMHAAGKGRSE